MIILYIVAFIVACALVGKLVTRSRDNNTKRFGGGFPRGQRPWQHSPDEVDPVENPRMVDDGTDFGYKEFD
jgi:hypothetical protein